MPSSDKDQPLERLDSDQLFAAVSAQGQLPRHVAIIMDGNGRWAKRRFLPRAAGHREGRHAVRSCVRACGRLGIDALTLYTFSLENFNRPPAEVQALWRFLQESLASECEALHRQGVRLVASGDLSRLPKEARSALDEVIGRLAGNTGLTLNLALAYGGRQEILHAALQLAQRLRTGDLQEAEVTEEVFRMGLYSPDLPDPDLVIRTSGESRLSNFLLWQSAYSEFLVWPVLWPDFRERDLLLAIADFQRRERRYGGLPRIPEQGGETKGESLLDPARWKRILKVKP